MEWVHCSFLVITTVCSKHKQQFYVNTFPSWLIRHTVRAIQLVATFAMVNHISKVGLSFERILSSSSSSSSFNGINKQGIRFLKFEACNCEEIKLYKIPKKVTSFKSKVNTTRPHLSKVLEKINRTFWVKNNRKTTVLCHIITKVAIVLWL